MVEPIYFLKPAWCGTPCAGLRPEQGLQPVRKALAFTRWFGHSVDLVLPRTVTPFQLNFVPRVLALGLRVDPHQLSPFFFAVLPFGRPPNLPFSRAIC